MRQAAAFVVVAFGLAFITFTNVVFVAPAIAERFLSHFASSARTHYAEQALRLLLGVALVVFSPVMWQSKAFWLVGWTIVVSSAALMCVPWQWHHGFGQRIRPIFMRYLKVYALGAFAFGALLLYGVFVGGRAA